jgi:nucleoside-diphosphate-sugar epimerase
MRVLLVGGTGVISVSTAPVREALQGRGFDVVVVQGGLRDRRRVQPDG